MGIQPGVPSATREALELEGEAHYRMPPKQKRVVFFEAASAEEIDPARVRRLRRLVESEKPHWVAAVKEQAVFYGPDDFENIVFWSGVPPEPARAILENLAERGEFNHPN